VNDEHPSEEQPVVRELQREERRLARLRLVAEHKSSEQPAERQWFSDDFDPDPQEAA
jgi:hypothetical protein